MWRWILRVLAIVLIAGTVGYPWVLDWAGRVFLTRVGGHLAHASTSYAGLDWEGLTVSGTGWRLELQSLQVGSPLGWLRGQIGGGARPIHAQGVEVVLEPVETASPEPAPSVSQILARVTKYLAALEPWLPPTEVESIRVEMPGGGVTVDRARWQTGRAVLEGMRWEGAALTLGGEAWRPTVESATLERWNPDHLHLQLSTPDGAHLRATLRPSARDEEVSAVLAAQWRGGHLDGSATLGAGWLPTQARVSGEATALPAQWSETFASWKPNIHWRASYEGATGRFDLGLEGSGVIPAEKPDQSPIPWTATVEANGDNARLAVEKLEVDVPFLQAQLNRALRLDRATLRPAEAAELDWALDLGASPVAEFASGLASGSISLRPGEALDGAHFSLRGEGRKIALGGGRERIESRRLSFAITGVADAARIDAAEISLQVDALGALQGKASWDRTHAQVGPFDLTGRLDSEGVARWVDTAAFAAPQGIAFSISGEGEARGLKHSGTVRIARALVAGTWPFSAELKWSGVDAAHPEWTLALQREAVGLAARGSLAWREGGGRLDLVELAETRQAGENWSLAAPASLEWSASANAPMAITVSPLQLTRRGAGTIELEGRWAGWGALVAKTRVRGVRPTDAAPWLEPTELPEFSAKSIEVEVTTTAAADGRFTWRGSGSIDATWVSPRGRSWVGRGGWRLEGERVVFDPLSLQTGETTWLHLQGSVPIGLRGGADRLFAPRVDPGGAIDMRAELEPVDRLPLPLEEHLPFSARALEGHLHATGTLEAPTAQGEIKAAEINWPATENFDAIELRDLALRATIQDQEIDLQELSLRLAETAEIQTISGEIGHIDWGQWWASPDLGRWIELSARLRLQKWPIASLGRWLPTQLEPVGRVSIALQKDVGDWPKGTVDWEGLTSQPFGGGLVARQIEGSARWNGERLDDLDVNGTIGGQPWELEGWIDVSNKIDPLFRLRLTADRLDLVRRPDLIVRGQAKIDAIHEDPEKPALLRGEISMLRSLFLKDLQDFTRQGAAGVAQRPPYFSVQAPPFADWGLDLRLSGDEFLQIRSTVLVGQASADFHLAGTLETPLLTGEAWIDGGSMLFPFARLPASELRGRITAEAPHTVQLTGQGEGVAYGYIVQYQLAGSAEDPELTFTSVPSLPQDDILLMIATGAVPSSEISTNATARAGRLALYLGQDIFSELFGQDGASRLEIRSGDGFSPFRRNGQVIEYQLNDDWSVLGEYDDFGGYNVDFRRTLLNR